MSLHWCSHQILFPGVSWLELLQSSGSPADSLWLLSAVNNRAEKNYSWWLLCCDLSDLSQSILPLGTAAAAEYSWPWPASSLNILWTTAGCISGYEIPPQQCQSGMWGTLPFPPRFTVRGVWTFHTNVFPLNQRENILKMSLRHRLLHDIGHVSSGSASFRVRRLEVHGLSVRGKIWLFWDFLSRFIELWSKSWPCFAAVSVIFGQFFSQPMNCMLDFPQAVGTALQGRGGTGIQRQGGSWGIPQTSPALIRKPLEWGRGIVTLFLLLPKEKKKVRRTQSQFYLKHTFVSRVCSLLEWKHVLGGKGTEG